VHGAGARGPIDWKDVDSLQKVKVKFDAFVRGGAAEAEELFMNEGKPVHCLSTRFEGVNYRVSMLIGMASVDSKGYIATYNPNYYNQFTGEMESEEARKSRTNGRSLLSFVKALEHTKRTKGCLVQVWAAHVLTLEPCGPAAEDPRARTRVHPGVLAAWPWQPLQTDRADERLYSDMQKAEKIMAEGMGIEVHAFEFKGEEVSEMIPPFPTGALKFENKKRDETAFKQSLKVFLLDHGICAEK
jgi:hypothetical protein